MPVKFQPDKLLHYLVTFAIMFFGSLLLGPLPALAAAIIFSVGKEVYDHYYGTGWSWGDLYADAGGIVCGGIAFAMIWVTLI